MPSRQTAHFNLSDIQLLSSIINLGLSCAAVCVKHVIFSTDATHLTACHRACHKGASHVAVAILSSDASPVTLSCQ
jgi:hypothetical protein